jgi:hypothetical protein
MWNTILKYGIFSAIFIVLAFFMMHKNIEYRELEKKEKNLMKNIYEAEENRRYFLYELEKLKKEKNYSGNSDKILILTPPREENPSQE